MSRRVKWLRRLRVILAAAVLLIFSAAVLTGFFPGLWFRTQFGSGVLSLAAAAPFWAVAAVLVILLVTALCGRIYCSVLCPLGILQDLLLRCRRGKFRCQPWKKRVRLPVLLLVIGLALGGVLLPLTLLLPSANFVIILQYALQTAVRQAAALIQGVPVPEALTVPAAVQLTAWGLFLLLLALVLWRGRLFCNTLCPVGAVLALAARRARYRIRIEAEQCVSCGACERICRTGGIDSRGKTVDFSECVWCLDCLNVCSKGALQFGRAPAVPFRADRRAFLTGAGALAGGAVLAPAVRLLGGKPPAPVMPPGAGTMERFTASCVGCGLCISVCPGGALKPAAGEYGLAGWLHPVLEPLRGACEFNCKACVDACPCGALRPLTLAEKQHTRIGLAQVTPARCVAWSAGEACGACGEHCPTGAIEMIPKDDITVPQVNETLCIGCGACENICPVRPEAAIVVRGVPVQTPVSGPAAEKKSEVSLPGEEGFPF